MVGKLIANKKADTIVKPKITPGICDLESLQQDILWITVFKCQTRSINNQDRDYGDIWCSIFSMEYLIK